MIVDTMSKYEVMSILRKEFDEEILTRYKKIRIKIENQYKSKCLRNKRFSTNYTENFTTKSCNHFNVNVKISHTGREEFFTCTFRWNDRTCFANFFLDKTVVVYQSHSLERYAQRVLNSALNPEDVFRKHIIKHQDAAYRIVLPTPTHEYSYYLGIADALFLGDFDAEHPEENYVWLNTCISYNETKFSQYQITQSLHTLQNFVKREGNLCKKENIRQLKDYIKTNESNPPKIEDLKTFLIYNHLFLQLHLHYKFEFTEKFKSEINDSMQYIESQLSRWGIDPNQFSPFDSSYKIANEEELLFKKATK